MPDADVADDDGDTGADVATLGDGVAVRAADAVGVVTAAVEAAAGVRVNGPHVPGHGNAAGDGRHGEGNDGGRPRPAPSCPGVLGRLVVPRIPARKVVIV